MRSLAFLACLAGMAAPHARAALLFNNGDTDDYMNFLDCSTCRGAGGVKVYDDFTVPASGWTITGISGNYFFQSTTPTLPTSGTWEIRSGMSQGVLGPCSRYRNHSVSRYADLEPIQLYGLHRRQLPHSGYDKSD